jgi:hypothetical protein
MHKSIRTRIHMLCLYKMLYLLTIMKQCKIRISKTVSIDKIKILYGLISFFLYFNFIYVLTMYVIIKLQNISIRNEPRITNKVWYLTKNMGCSYLLHSFCIQVLCLAHWLNAPHAVHTCTNRKEKFISSISTFVPLSVHYEILKWLLSIG